MLTFRQINWIKSENSQDREGDAGFTLIEILVVVVIIALMSVIALPTVGSYFQVSINSAARDMATVIREAYNATVITGRVHRLAYEFKENTYWVESGPPDALLDTDESREKEERKAKFFSSKPATPSAFNLERAITRKKISLPRGVTFEDIVTEQSEKPLVEGVAYTHFFSHGITEQTIIHLKDQSNHQSSLVITPLLGMTDLYGRYVDKKEISAK